MNSRLLSWTKTSFFCKPVGALQAARAGSYAGNLTGIDSPSPAAANEAPPRHRTEAIADSRKFIAMPSRARGRQDQPRRRPRPAVDVFHMCLQRRRHGLDD